MQTCERGDDRDEVIRGHHFTRPFFRPHHHGVGAVGNTNVERVGGEISDV